MKKLILLTLIPLFFSCQSENQKISEDNSAKTEQVNDSEKLDIVFEEFKMLYNNLLEFKSDEGFIEYGFGEGGPYNDWLEKVEELKNNTDSKLLIQKGLLAGDLEQLGLAYAGSKGKETEVTKSFNEIFSEAIGDNSN